LVPKLNPNKIRPNTPDSKANKLFPSWNPQDDQRHAERQASTGDQAPKRRRNIKETST